jgi:hypothetical protein
MYNEIMYILCSAPTERDKLQQDKERKELKELQKEKNKNFYHR